MSDPVPVSKEEARLLFARECDFVLAAAEAAHFPETKLPEISFIGRSNVGKSSLINALTGRKGLARTSSTPGRTQQIVFFDLAKRLMLVDLPGYGHAEAPRAEKDNWNALVQYYMRQRRTLKCVCLLIDGRHGAKANDLEMMGILDRAAITYKAVVTKIDQVKPAEREQRREEIAHLIARHPAALAGVILTSSDKREGLDELQVFMAGFAKP
ncbi:MAG: ribosome biogenesis GTP-binding protein YihA/YsxC [Alphaproteobacteria bacterium]|nr:ribosome biogenesis GTP-binding protein YihA/YsxC [Alphaproteobacteria bacterium]